MTLKYFCCDERRRAAILAHSTLNGIDFVEVRDDPADPPAERQRTLLLHFLKPLPPRILRADNLRIEGGERITNVTVVAIEQGGSGSPPSSLPHDVVAVRTSTAGDFSRYTLRVVSDANPLRPPAWLDPIHSAVDFSFKVACPSEFDCEAPRVCPPEIRDRPEINYLAKDYASFRQLMLDRMAVLAPSWTERSPADFGIALVELLAYVADRLSYEQDARHTEAYLRTARKRVSVRRLARFVDYAMHDGCNARVWAQIVVRADVAGLTLAPEAGGVRTKLFTRVNGIPTIVRAGSRPWLDALAAVPEVFEVLEPVDLHAAHNEMPFYDWGDEACCLPRGAVKATLRGAFPALARGAVLVLGEKRGSRTGNEADADSSRRHAVRLTRASIGEDPLGGRFDNPATDLAVALTEIEWDGQDALPFPLCISARADGGLHRDLSVAWGNIVLADHGRTIDVSELLPRVPEPHPALVPVSRDAVDRCEEIDPQGTPVRYRPALASSPLAQATPSPADPSSVPAVDTLRSDPRKARPAIHLIDLDSNLEWLPRRDLLSSGPDAREFVVEVEADGRARLRFGDDTFGARPAAYTRFAAIYRVGNGSAGNVGAGALAHIASADAELTTEIGPEGVISRVWNPLPASSGVDPESVEQARQNAPEAFRTQERAVTETDYADKATEVGGYVQRAAATFRWTGSWHTVFVTADRFGGRPVDQAFVVGLRAGLERFRMAGHDLEVDAPQPVPLEIHLTVCLLPGYFASDLQRTLLDLFSSRVLPDGSLGVFHPDNFSFGQPVFLSPIYAAAQRVDGVASVRATRFHRQGRPATSALGSGRLDMGRLEVAQLENDPNFPERGVFRVRVQEAIS